MNIYGSVIRNISALNYTDYWPYFEMTFLPLHYGAQVALAKDKR